MLGSALGLNVRLSAQPVPAGSADSETLSIAGHALLKADTWRQQKADTWGQQRGEASGACGACGQAAAMGGRRRQRQKRKKTNYVGGLWRGLALLL